MSLQLRHQPVPTASVSIAVARAILLAAVLNRADRMVGETIDHVIDPTEVVGLARPHVLRQM
jgi:hypothetical protein